MLLWHTVRVELWDWRSGSSLSHQIPRLVFPLFSRGNDKLRMGGGGGGGDRGSESPSSRTLYFRFPAAFFSGFRFCVLCLLEIIAQRCEIYFLFLPATSPMGIPSPTLASSASRRLHAPITPEFPSPDPSTSMREKKLQKNVKIDKRRRNLKKWFPTCPPQPKC